MYKEGNHDKAIELLDDLALNILYDDSNKNQDPFWEKTSADYFSGVALGLFEDAKPDEWPESRGRWFTFWLLFQ